MASNLNSAHEVHMYVRVLARSKPDHTMITRMHRNRMLLQSARWPHPHIHNTSWTQTLTTVRVIHHHF